MINIGINCYILSLVGPPWPDSDNHSIDGSRRPTSVCFTHLNAFQSPTVILELLRTVFSCFISQTWPDRRTNQLS